MDKCAESLFTVRKKRTDKKRKREKVNLSDLIAGLVKGVETHAY